MTTISTMLRDGLHVLALAALAAGLWWGVGFGWSVVVGGMLTVANIGVLGALVSLTFRAMERDGRGAGLPAFGLAVKSVAAVVGFAWLLSRFEPVAVTVGLLAVLAGVCIAAIRRSLREDAEQEA